MVIPSLMNPWFPFEEKWSKAAERENLDAWEIANLGFWYFLEQKRSMGWPLERLEKAILSWENAFFEHQPWTWIKDSPNPDLGDETSQVDSSKLQQTLRHKQERWLTAIQTRIQDFSESGLEVGEQSFPWFRPFVSYRVMPQIDEYAMKSWGWIERLADRAVNRQAWLWASILLGQLRYSKIDAWMWSRLQQQDVETIQKLLEEGCDDCVSKIRALFSVVKEDLLNEYGLGGLNHMDWEQMFLQLNLDEKSLISWFAWSVKQGDQTLLSTYMDMLDACTDKTRWNQWNFEIQKICNEKYIDGNTYIQENVLNTLAHHLAHHSLVTTEKVSECLGHALLLSQRALAFVWLDHPLNTFIKTPEDYQHFVKETFAHQPISYDEKSNFHDEIMAHLEAKMLTKVAADQVGFEPYKAIWCTSKSTKIRL